MEPGDSESALAKNDVNKIALNLMSRLGLILLDFYLRFLFNLRTRWSRQVRYTCHENSKWQGAIKRFITNGP